MVRRFLIVGSFASIYLFWGTTYFAIAIGLQSIPPFVLMGFRSLAGGLILIALCGREIGRASLRTWLGAAIAGVLFFAGCHGVLAWAQQTVSSGLAAIALATIPLWILLLDVLWSEDRPGRYSVLAVVPGFVGVAIVAWQNVSAGHASLAAIAALLLAALSWAIGTVLSRSAAGDVSTTVLSGMQLSIGGLVLFAIAFLTGELRGFALTAVTARSLEAAAYLTLSGSVIGFAAYHWLLKSVPTPLVATYTFVNPVVAVILGVVLLGEPISAAMIAGAGLVLVSIVAMWGAEIFTRPAKKKGAPACAGAPRRSGHCRVCARTEVVGRVPWVAPWDQAPGGNQ